MAKTFAMRRTGRKFTRSRTFRKRRFTRALISRPGQITSLPTQFFSPLPAKMNVSLRLTYQQDLALSSTVTVSGFVSTLAVPSNVDDAGSRQFPGGFLPLMQLYGKSQVCRAHVCHQMYNVNDVPSGIGDVVCALLPFGTEILSPTQQFQQVSAIPGSRRFVLGRATGGQPCFTDNYFVDVAKYIGDPLTREQSIVADLLDFTNGLTFPSVSEELPLPMYAVILRLGLTPLVTEFPTFRSMITVDYHMEFTSPRGLATTIADNITSATFSWNQRT